MALIAVQPGLHTTIQDRGRLGYRHVGVPHDGAFDRESHDMANALVANHTDAATLELTLLGGRWRAEVPLALALAGAGAEARVERAGRLRFRVASGMGFSLEPGDELAFDRFRTGARTYLATHGGWLTPLILGSRSDETPLRAGDRLRAGSARISRSRFDLSAEESLDPLPLRILPGPEAGSAFDKLSAGVYTVDRRSNRVGVRLVGPGLDSTTDPERLSTPVFPGAIQIAGGQPLVLGVAGGTMGGYPHVAQLARIDLPRLAQLKAGDRVVFLPIPLPQALDLLRERTIRHESERFLLAARQTDGVVRLGSPVG